MDWNKYNQVPTEYATASAIGLTAATLGAMARRGYVEVLDTKPKQYRRAVTPAIKVFQMLEQHKGEYGDYFTLWKEGKEIGMLCSLDKSGDVLDCWGNKYDPTGVNKIGFRQKEYNI